MHDTVGGVDSTILFSNPVKHHSQPYYGTMGGVDSSTLNYNPVKHITICWPYYNNADTGRGRQ